jgi:hypothetical protein
MYISSVLRPLTGGVSAVEIPSVPISELPVVVRQRFPLLAERLFDEDDRLRESIGLYVDGQDIRDVPRETVLGEESEFVVMVPISGG